MPLAVFSLSASKVAAVKCGIKGVTNPCVGDTDPRYDDSVGCNFVEQNDFWKKHDGLFIIDDTYFNKNGTIIVSEAFDIAPQLGEYNRLPTRQYLNVTVTGSRIHMNGYLMVGNIESYTPGFVSITNIATNITTCRIAIAFMYQNTVYIAALARHVLLDTCNNIIFLQLSYKFKTK